MTINLIGVGVLLICIVLVAAIATIAMDDVMKALGTSALFG